LSNLRLNRAALLFFSFPAENALFQSGEKSH
jgi:hypothetical protein